MKVYLVCKSFCYGYEDHGWSIEESFIKEEDAIESLKKLELENRSTEVDYYIDTTEVR